MENNKYSKIINSSPDSEERRKERKKKRQRASLAAFLSLLLVVAIIVAICIFAGRTIVKAVSDSKTSVSVSETSTSSIDDVTSAIEEIIGSEDIVSVSGNDIIDDVPTEEELYESWLEEKIANLSLEEKVMGLFIVTPEQLMDTTKVTQAGDKTKTTLENTPVGGIIYSDINIESLDQFSQMISKSKEFVRYETFFILNEELGSGNLVKKLKLTATDNAETIGETMDPYKAYEASSTISSYLKSVGINMNIGLVGDVLYSPNEDEEIDYFMKGRAFGNDPTIVSRMVTESVKAYEEAGINVAVGSFPGQGNLEKDPGEAVVSTDVSSEQMLSYMQPVYESAVTEGLDAIIVSHVYDSNISSENLPCSLSKEIYTDILRNTLGLYDTILITDALSKPAVADYYTSDEACVKAIKAGADMVMCPENFEEGYKAVIDAVNSGVIAEERINDSLMRVWKVKYREAYKEEMQPTD